MFSKKEKNQKDESTASRESGLGSTRDVQACEINFYLKVDSSRTCYAITGFGRGEKTFIECLYDDIISQMKDDDLSFITVGGSKLGIMVFDKSEIAGFSIELTR